MQPLLMLAPEEEKKIELQLGEVKSKYWSAEKDAEPFVVDFGLTQFLSALRVRLSEDHSLDTLSAVQYEKRHKQTAKLLLMIEEYTMKNYRKLILSAMTGMEILTQKQLDWWQQSAIIDALKGETDNGQMVLQQIQNDLVGHASCRANTLYAFLWADDESDMSDM